MSVRLDLDIRLEIMKLNAEITICKDTSGSVGEYASSLGLFELGLR